MKNKNIKEDDPEYIIKIMDKLNGLDKRLMFVERDIKWIKWILGIFILPTVISIILLILKQGV